MDDNVSDDVNQRDMLQLENKSVGKYRISKTAVLQQIWITQGLWSSILTPCIDILRANTNTNYEEISRALAARSIGIIFGSAVGGFLADYFQRWLDLQLAAAVALAGISFGMIPWLSNLYLLSASFLVTGLCQGSLSAGGNAHALQMWGKDAHAPFQFIHAGFGLGTVLGPLLLIPFVSTKDNSEDRNKSLTVNEFYLPSHHQYLQSDTNIIFFTTENACVNSTSNTTNVGHNVWIPFVVTGGYCLINALLIGTFVFCPYMVVESIKSEQLDSSPANRLNRLKKVLTPGSCADGDAKFGIMMFTLIFVFYIVLIGRNGTVATFIQPVAVHTPTLEFTLKEASYLIMTSNICYTSGRLLLSITGRWVPVQVALFAETILMIGTVITLIVFGLDSKMKFWITISLYSFCNGPMFPTGMAWCDRYVKMTAVAFSVLDIGVGCGTFAFNWISGFIVNKYLCNNIKVLYYITLGLSILTLSLLVIMQTLGSSHGDRYKEKIIVDEQNIVNNDIEDYGDDNDNSKLIS